MYMEYHHLGHLLLIYYQIFKTNIEIIEIIEIIEVVGKIDIYQAFNLLVGALYFLKQVFH